VAAVTPAPETMAEILAEDVAAQTHRERSYPLELVTNVVSAARFDA
jgi:hypothetical protein